MLRLARAGFVLARAGVFSDVDPSILPPAARLPLALAKLLARGTQEPAAPRAPAKQRAALPIFPARSAGSGRPMSSSANSSRRGRMSSASPLFKQLERLQDRMEPFPRAVAIATIEAAFGEPLGRTFMSFGEPVAAASIAQVHRARVK